MRLAGQSAIVTGSSRGMGKYFATTLAREGARVALFARASDALDRTAADIGANALPVACDISDPDAVRAAFEVVEAEFGSLDILVNNAGMSTLGRAWEYSDAAISRQIGVNFTGPIYTCRSAVPLLRKSSRASIVNVSSESVKAPYPMLSVYAAAKMGLEYYTRALRKELRPLNIRVSILRSGFVAGGEMSTQWDDPELRDEFVRVAREQGSFIESGTQGAPAQAMADALVGLLTMDPALNADIMELRPLAP